MSGKKISIEDFKKDPVLNERFRRGKEVARALDAKAPRLPYSSVSLEDAALCLEAQAKGEIPDHRRVVSGALALDTLIQQGEGARDIRDAAAGLRTVAEGGALDLNGAGRARATILAADIRRFVNFDESKET